MIKIGICEDEAPARAYLASLVRAQGCPCEITEYAAAADCLAAGGEMDLLFLDIALEGGPDDGMALARRLRAGDPAAQPVIVFVTGHERYVFDAFDVGAFQYLLKPVDEAKFAQVFARAVAQIGAGERPGRTLTLPPAGGGRTVPLERIRYIESCDHKVVLHLRDGQFACYAKLRDLEAELGDPFCRIHKGYLVSLAWVEAYSRTELTLTGGEKLPISKYKYPDFVKAHFRYLKQGAGL